MVPTNSTGNHSLNSTLQPNSPQKSQHRLSDAVRMNDQTTLTSAKQQRKLSFILIGTILYPLIKIGGLFSSIVSYILDHFLPFCKYHHQERLDWEKTKYVFQKIVKGHTDNKNKQIENFYKRVGQLSSIARERFKTHVGFSIAEIENKIPDRALQEDWFNKNHHKIRYEKYSLTGEVMEKAINTFWKEIQSKALNNANSGL